MPALQAQGRQIHLQSLQLVDETAIVDQTGGGAPPTNKRTKKKWSHKYSQTKQNNKDTRPMRGLYKEITPLPILLIQPTQLSVFLNITHHWDTTLHRATAYYIVFILYYTTHHVITCCATLHTCTHTKLTLWSLRSKHCVLCCTVSVILCYTTLHHVALHYMVLHHNAAMQVALHCTPPHFIVLRWALYHALLRTHDVLDCQYECCHGSLRSTKGFGGF